MLTPAALFQVVVSLEAVLLVAALPEVVAPQAVALPQAMGALPEVEATLLVVPDLTPLEVLVLTHQVAPVPTHLVDQGVIPPEDQAQTPPVDQGVIPPADQDLLPQADLVPNPEVVAAVVTGATNPEAASP